MRKAQGDARTPPPLTAGEKVLYGIGCVVTIVWSISVLVSQAFPNRDMDAQVHTVMLLVAGGCFALGGVRGRRERKNGDDA